MKILNLNEKQFPFYNGHKIAIAFEKYSSDYDIDGIQITADYVKKICHEHLRNTVTKQDRWGFYTGAPHTIDDVVYRYFITFNDESDLTLILLRL